jgi:hypothetical protein
MIMKKLIPLLFTALLFASCEKVPNLDEVQEDYVVYTQYDKDANFSKGKHFYVPDSVLVVSGKGRGATYLDASDANDIINAYSIQMEKRGYVKTADKTEANYGLQISYVESTYYFINSVSWWSDYPWYWSPSYWWPWYDGNWFYPYQFIYKYTYGSLICEMIDLSSVSEVSSSSKPTVIWNNYITGIYYIDSNMLPRLVKAVNQSFEQSPYIKF